MKKILKTMFLFCLASLPTAVQAQSEVIVEDEISSNGIVMVTIDKADDEIIRIMSESQLNYIHDPKAPRFLLMDRQGKFALGIGGYVRAVGEYDFGGVADDIDFIPADIPNSSAVKQQFQMDASTSTIFLKLVGHTRLLGDFTVYTAGNFRGNDDTFQLLNAYMTFRNITVGYTYGGFMDLGAVPPTIDYQGPNGASFYRATQLSYAYKGLKNFRFGASVEAPSVDATTGNGLQITRQRVPDFTASVQYNWSSNSHVRLAGIVRSMSYSDTQSDKTHSVTGYGLQASTALSCCKKWQAYAQVSYGKGIAQCLNDLGTLNADLVPDPEREGRMQALPMLGWYAGLQYNLSPRVFLSATYSLARLYSCNGYPAGQPTAYRYGQYLVANAFWNVTPNMQVGAEYLRGWRTDFSRTTRHANRLNLLVQYSF